MKRIRNMWVIKGENGGRYKDRTCDHYDVNVDTISYLIDLSRFIKRNVLQSFVFGSRHSWAIMGAAVTPFRWVA